MAARGPFGWLLAAAAQDMLRQAQAERNLYLYPTPLRLILSKPARQGRPE